MNKRENDVESDPGNIRLEELRTSEAGGLASVARPQKRADHRLSRDLSAQLYVYSFERVFKKS
jgi:hypothetical protein